MNQPTKHSSYPTPDENRIEELLSNTQPTPGKAFYTRMQSAPWRAVQTKRNTPMKTKFAFYALAMLLVIGATVAFVPPARAQVQEWFTFTLKTIGIGSVEISQEGEPLPYQIMQPSYVPQVFESGTNLFSFGENGSENIFLANENFLVITQQLVKEDEVLPSGEPFKINGASAVLNTGLSGHYQQNLELTGSFTSMVESIQYPSDDVGGGDGVATFEKNVTATPSIEFDYTDANKLTFFINGNKIEILSNLSIDEIVKVATALMPAQ